MTSTAKDLRTKLAKLQAKYTAGATLTDSERAALRGKPGGTPQPKAGKLVGTLNAWAVALGREPRTLERVLTRHGMKVTAGQVFSAKEIFAGLLGDETVEKIRNLKADADRKEREEREARGDLVRWAEVEKVVTDCVVAPLRPVLLSIDTTLDVRCNSKDPAEARKALREWADETLKLLREKLPNPRKK